MTNTTIFDREVPLPDAALTEQETTLLHFDQRYAHINQQLRLLMHLGELPAWSVKFHKRPVKITEFVAGQYPLVVFHGDVGTGKTVMAESLANRLVREDTTKSEAVLFKLSTRVRGSGRVGEMGTLISEAFAAVIKSAGKRRRAVLIIDEGDSLASKRSQEQSHHEDKVAVNTLIQAIDDLRQYEGRVLVILCTNRLSVLDPAILRRAAVTMHFGRPSEAERTALFSQDLADLDFSPADIQSLVTATGSDQAPGTTFTYSDIRTRLYPAALAQVFPDAPLTLDVLIQTARTVTPSPIMEDL